MNNAEALAKVTGSTSATYTVERRNADGTLTVESVETYTRPTGHDMRKAWQFVVDSYDMTYSPSRREWSDADILEFVAEYHIDGADAFKNQPE